MGEEVLKDESKKKMESELRYFETRLSLERTLMSYTRTSLTLVVVGMSFIQFLDDNQSKWTGGLFCLAGLVLYVVGYRRVHRRRRWLRDFLRKMTEKEPV